MAVSIPSNVAEGYGRHATRAYINHVNIALGTEAELQKQLELAHRRRLTTKAAVDPLLADASDVGRMLNGLATSLERSEPR